MKRIISFFMSITVSYCVGTFLHMPCVFAEENVNAVNDKFVLSENLEALNVLKSISKLKLDNLTLSIPKKEDLKDLAKYYKDVEIRYYLYGNDMEMSEKEAFAELVKYNSGNNVSFIIKDNDNNTLGEIILSCLKNKFVNIAYWIKPEFRGHSYSSKVCVALIKEMHRKDSSFVFLINFDEKNYNSIRVFEKIKSGLTLKNTSKKANNFKENNYKIGDMGLFKLKYKILPAADDTFYFYIFVNDKEIASGVLTKRQIEEITYKKIFELNEIEINKLNYFIKFAS